MLNEKYNLILSHQVKGLDDSEKSVSKALKV